MTEKKRQLRDFASHTLKRTNKYPLYRIAYELAAWLTPIMVIGFSYLVYTFFHSSRALTELMLVWLGLGVVSVFVRCRTLAKRYAVDTPRVIHHDERQPSCTYARLSTMQEAVIGEVTFRK
jgi:hypothetical protein